MSSYSSVLGGSYSLSKENMRIHLEHEHEEKMNIIDNIHSEAMERLSNERNRDNNYHSQQMQRLRSSQPTVISSFTHRLMGLKPMVVQTGKLH